MNSLFQYIIFSFFGLSLLVGVIIIIRNAIRIRGSIRRLHHKIEEQNKVISAMKESPNFEIKKPAVKPPSRSAGPSSSSTNKFSIYREE